MSPRRWILLLIFYISYLMFGASIYYHIEHGLEKQQRAEELKERIEINAYLVDQLTGKNATTQEAILQRISDYCGKMVTDYKTDEFEDPYTWTFYHSFFFAFTVCSTVGYGNISPSSTLGRMIMIAYSVIGIPINGILFAGLGEYFGKTFQAIYRRYKKYKLSNDVRYMPPQLGLITTVLIALIPGVTMFIFLPSWVFSYFEDWPYSLAVYYSYVTTTTIGFGDFVPTFQAHQPRKFGNWFIVYEIFVIVWFIFSLGYLLMIMTFITRGLQSKKLAYLEEQLSSNIKATQNRIWHGVTKDVGYLRRILNELYIMKFKPVYSEAAHLQPLHRSHSCPELTMYRIEAPIIKRKRALSESYDLADTHLQLHTASDSDLDKFDRQKSFESTHALRQTTNLLARVVSALATVKPPSNEMDALGAYEYAGYNGFSDSQILASEWSTTQQQQQQQHWSRCRGRACSDFNINANAWHALPRRIQNEWTWSGGDNNQIQEAINKRVKQTHGNALQRATPLDYVIHLDADNNSVLEDGQQEELRKPRTKKFSIPESLRKLFPFKRLQRSSSQTESPTSQLRAADRKYSVMSMPESAAEQQSTTLPNDALNYYSTVTANSSLSYLKHEPLRRRTAARLPTIQQSPPSTADSENIAERMPELLYASEPSLSSRLSSVALNGNGGAQYGSFLDADPCHVNASFGFQRCHDAPMTVRKSRASLFTQNNATSSARRGSLFASMNAAAMTQRRGSLYAMPRRGSNVSATVAANERRRPSLLSLSSADEIEVLERTTLADLIRALEVMHTQAVLHSVDTVGDEKKAERRKRKLSSTAACETHDFPNIFTLFAGDNSNNRLLNTNAVNNFYARRSTIVGTLPNMSPPPTAATLMPRAQRRRLSSVHDSESFSPSSPPPSYSERSNTNAAPQFKRRFSIRPTTLQIPPGMAPEPIITSTPLPPPPPPPPPPLSSLDSIHMLPPYALAAKTSSRRTSPLRPSPLARDTYNTQGSGSISDDSGFIGGPTRGPPTTMLTSSSTHSPLSRIAQISQAQRKSSMPDGFALERNKKSESDKYY